MEETLIISLMFKLVVGIGIFSVLCICYSLFTAVEEFRKSTRIMLLAALLTNSGIIVHTYAILKYGTELSQVYEFVIGHVLIMMGILALVWWSKEMENTAKIIGFGG